MRGVVWVAGEGLGVVRDLVPGDVGSLAGEGLPSEVGTGMLGDPTAIGTELERVALNAL